MFILHLRPARGIDKVKMLRWLLKRAQRLGLKAVSVVEIPEEPDKTKDNANAKSRP
jgi:hypothetical protein